jgi:hypothetical protein
MRFGHPWWLAGGLAACVLLIWVWRVVDARQRAALEKFVSPHLRVELTRSISVTRRRVQRGLYLAAVALLFAALAGPLVGSSWIEISRRGNEIVFAVDTSRSMLTPDVKPNRLARAKLAIDDFTARALFWCVPSPSTIRRFTSRLAQSIPTPSRAAAPTSQAPFVRRKLHCAGGPAATKP